ncbi:40_t:CDS:1, partial [Gigaspora rosea]
RGRPRKQVGESSLEAELLNFRVAKDIVGCDRDLLEKEISNLRNLQSDNE